jgi:hypothetical protein
MRSQGGLLPATPSMATLASAFRLNRDLDLQTEACLQRRRGCVIGDLLRCRTGEQQDVADATAPKLEQQYVQEGKAIYFKQRSWFWRGERPKWGFEIAA